jgi:fluoride ion exporter CrcB/FEX
MDLPRFEWREHLDTLYLCCFGVLGTLLRGGLVYRFACYSTAAGISCRSLDEGVTFLALAPNMLGCFVAGLLATPGSAGQPGNSESSTALACLSQAHRWQRLTRLHVGLRVGFCGSLTTWAGWNQSMVQRCVDGDWARGLMGYVVGAELAGASLQLGHHAAGALWQWRSGCRAPGADATEGEQSVVVPAGEAPPTPLLSQASARWVEDSVCLAVLLASLSGCAVVVGTADAFASRSICLAALCGPFGVLLRWYMGRWKLQWLPAGTLAANSLGAMVAAAVAASRSGRYWSPLLNDALQAGFAGGLSTVSTVAAETTLLMRPPTRWQGYAYLALTFLFGFAPAAAIYGGATR